MKKIYSLKGRNLFKKVYITGRKIQGRGVQIFVLKHDDFIKRNPKTKILFNNKITQIGISISKRFGKAIARNKEKRKIRSICRDLLAEMNSGFYLIIKPDVSFKNYSYEEQKQIIRLLFQKARVVNQ